MVTYIYYVYTETWGVACGLYCLHVDVQPCFILHIKKHVSLTDFPIPLEVQWKICSTYLKIYERYVIHMLKVCGTYTQKCLWGVRTIFESRKKNT